MIKTCENCKHCLKADSDTNPFDEYSIPEKWYGYLSVSCGVCDADPAWPLVVSLDNKDCYDGWNEWEPCDWNDYDEENHGDYDSYIASLLDENYHEPNIYEED